MLHILPLTPPFWYKMDGGKVPFLYSPQNVILEPIIPLPNVENIFFWKRLKYYFLFSKAQRKIQYEKEVPSIFEKFLLK